MAKKRFLRDKALDDILVEIRRLADTISASEIPAFRFNQSLQSITSLYETCKLSLGFLENALDRLRWDKANREVIQMLSESAKQMQTAMVQLHQQIKQQLTDLLDELSAYQSQIQEIRKFTGFSK